MKKNTEIFTNKRLIVLKKISQGLTDAEIAEDLNVSIHTIRGRITKMIDLLGAKNRTHLVCIAIKNGLIK